jgi:hypothetical protein
MYVDDYLGSATFVAEAVEEAVTVKNSLSAVDLKLQGWISNSPEFIQEVSKTDRPVTATPSAHPLTSESTEKVLGVVWDIKLPNHVMQP